MSLLNDIRDETRRRGGVCGVWTALQSLDDADRRDLLAAVDDRAVAAAAISRALKRRGVTLAGSSIGRHRRGECICDAR